MGPIVTYECEPDCRARSHNRARCEAHLQRWNVEKQGILPTVAQVTELAQKVPLEWFNKTRGDECL